MAKKTRIHRVIRLQVEVEATDLAATVIEKILNDVADGIKFSADGKFPEIRGLQFISSEVIETTNKAAIKAATK